MACIVEGEGERCLLFFFFLDSPCKSESFLFPGTESQGDQEVCLSLMVSTDCTEGVFDANVNHGGGAVCFHGVCGALWEAQFQKIFV